MAFAHEQARGDAAGGATSSVVADASELRQRGSKGHKKPGTVAEDDDKESGRGAGAGAGAAGGCEVTVTDSIERVFEAEPVPPWPQQVTPRALVTSLFLAVLFSVIVMKLSLTTGIIPSLNVSAGLLGFFLLRVWTAAVKDPRRPFTRQENTVVQTCVVSAYGIAFSGGFGSYLFGMSETIASQAAEENNAGNVKEPRLAWMIGFLFLVSFVGLFALVPLRKVMIIDYRLTYPSGTATAHLINGFHTPDGSERAKSQVLTLIKSSVASFFWGFFQWFYTAGDGCGFGQFPALGLAAYQNRFYFDFSTTYVGAGMICPHTVNVSVLLGGILSWGLLWPLIAQKRGSWFDAKLPDSSLEGMQGYRVFIAIAIILGDGLYKFATVLLRTVASIAASTEKRKFFGALPVNGDGSNGAAAPAPPPSFDDARRTEFFTKDQIPVPVAIGGYVVIAAVSVAAVPRLIFPQLEWYHVLAVYLMAPVLAFCNAYGMGLTDWSLASTYGKLAIFAFGAWAGKPHSGVLVGLATCGIMMNIVSTAADLMQDLKTGYMTLASPRSMFVSQVVGTAMGCVVGPSVFWLFYRAFPGVGTHRSAYPAPYALIYRNMAILGVDGFSKLPDNCLTLCCVFFVGAIAVDMARDMAPEKVAKFVPLPMAMAIPFYIGPYFAIDMFLGSVVLFAWEWVDKDQANFFAYAVASGLICGDGVWSLPQALLSLFNVKPPICMKFLSRHMNDKVDDFIATLS
ncbi:putative metal-nicotianamine transporter YSL7 [Zea mays]|nr:putative metal-nicotianamine transporter YSL7 [Zea mays]